jgi:hypothetical protein
MDVRERATACRRSPPLCPVFSLTSRTSGKSTKLSRCQAKLKHACYLYSNTNAVQDRRGKTTRRAWPEQWPCYPQRVYMLVHGLCRRQHTPPCMKNAKRRPKTTTKQFNQRYLAVLSAGVINQVLSEALETRKPQSSSHTGHASKPHRAHPWD